MPVAFDLPFNPKLRRIHALAASAAILSILAGVVAGYLVYGSRQTVHARLDVPNPRYVRLLDPVTVRFDQTVDDLHSHVSVAPSLPLQLRRLRDRIVITPAQGWQPEGTYTVLVADVPTIGHDRQPLRSWKATFRTQPRVSVGAYTINGRPAPQGGSVLPTDKLGITFSTPMSPSATAVTLNGQRVAAERLQWSAGDTAVSLEGRPWQPYSKLVVAVPSGTSAIGDALSADAGVTFAPEAIEPSNPASGVDAGFKVKRPVLAVIDNAGGARPQTGLQQADMVYEYLTEYSISRMTAVYFNNPSPVLGPIRSCRMINPYLEYALDGATWCSGASVGTLHWIFGFEGGPGTMPVVLDTADHFFRSGARAVPHNLYTDDERIREVRDQYVQNRANYLVDPPHADQVLGAPADPPSVPLQSVSWSYDANSQQYLRFDHGAPFFDHSTNQQLAAKNVVVMHVPFRDAGWVEDDFGSAHSIWYSLSGQGPAEVWSDGHMVHGSWHFQEVGDAFWTMSQPMWFSDDKGDPIELNTGLTWIHVVGNGQDS